MKNSSCSCSKGNLETFLTANRDSSRRFSWTVRMKLSRERLVHVGKFGCAIAALYEIEMLVCVMVPPWSWLY